jgi:ribosomal-protein-alanine N-acetyltransferase
VSESISPAPEARAGRLVLETARLRLRELTPDDLPFVATMMGDPEVMRFYPKVLTTAEAKGWLDRQLARYAADGHGLWLVQDRETGEPRGQVGLAMQDLDGTREPEIGWLIHHPFWRQGFASEAARGVLRWAFAHRDWDHVISLIRPENTPSQGVAYRLGMAPMRRAMFHGYDHHVFRLWRPLAPDA